MAKVIVSPSPNTIGMAPESDATAEPLLILPSQGSSFCVGIDSDPVASAAMLSSEGLVAFGPEQATPEIAHGAVSRVGRGVVALSGHVIAPLVRLTSQTLGERPHGLLVCDRVQQSGVLRAQ